MSHKLTFGMSLWPWCPMHKLKHCLLYGRPNGMSLTAPTCPHGIALRPSPLHQSSGHICMTPISIPDPPPPSQGLPTGTSKKQNGIEKVTNPENDLSKMVTCGLVCITSRPKILPKNPLNLTPPPQPPPKDPRFRTKKPPKSYPSPPPHPPPETPRFRTKKTPESPPPNIPRNPIFVPKYHPILTEDPPNSYQPPPPPPAPDNKVNLKKNPIIPKNTLAMPTQPSGWPCHTLHPSHY